MQCDACNMDTIYICQGLQKLILYSEVRESEFRSSMLFRLLFMNYKMCSCFRISFSLFFPISWSTFSLVASIFLYIYSATLSFVSLPQWKRGIICSSPQRSGIPGGLLWCGTRQWHNDWANEFLNQSICFTPFTWGQVGRNNTRDWGEGEIGQDGIKKVVSKTEK